MTLSQPRPVAPPLPIPTLLEQFHQQGIQLWVDQDKLKLHAPKGVITAELQVVISARKAEILDFLQNSTSPGDCSPCQQEQISPDTLSPNTLSLDTIGRLISGWQVSGRYTPPAISPEQMARQLRVTFRPLPTNYAVADVLQLRTELEQQLQACGVTIVDWNQATRDYAYQLPLPGLPWRPQITTRAVKANISAVIDVERPVTSLWGKFKVWAAECFYWAYRKIFMGKTPLSVTKIAQLINWAEPNIQALEDPTNTQVIALTPLNPEFVNPDLAYPKKIPIGVGTLVRTFAEIVVGVSPQQLSILNMNLSDSVYRRQDLADFVLKSLVPKIFVPILPLPLSRFQVGEFDPTQSDAAIALRDMGRNLAPTGLLPAGFKIDDVIQRRSHRDIVDWMANGRTGVSYGFICYIEPPQYYGDPEVSAEIWATLTPVPGFNPAELRQNASGRRYLRTQNQGIERFQQIPDLWLVSSRSGANKTDLNLENDILRVGLQDRLLLQLPLKLSRGLAGTAVAREIKPSYDTYVMVAVALAAALFTPDLLAQGAPLIHFHGYPAPSWFQAEEYFSGTHNPSVPCGTYESGVFNFLGLMNLTRQHGNAIQLAALIEPDHGTNILARDVSTLLQRLQQGLQSQQVELGGKHYPALRAQGEVLS
jgi:hypothetical protein